MRLSRAVGTDGRESVMTRKSTGQKRAGLEWQEEALGSHSGPWIHRYKKTWSGSAGR